MLAFTLRRAIQAIAVMIAVGIIAFSMFRFAVILEGVAARARAGNAASNDAAG